jgi:hypothetical protein
MHGTGQRIEVLTQEREPVRDGSSLVALLTSGGDARVACDPATGANKYGCTPTPRSDILAYGSATASIISSAGFAAAERLYVRIQRASGVEFPAAVYAAELMRMRAELLRLCGFELPGPEVIFGPSGTDLHRFAACLAAAAAPSPLLVVTIEPAETGSGVPAALAGVTATNPDPAVELAVVALRAEDGTPRPAELIDREVETLVEEAVAAGRQVLLTLTDVTKTGLIGPSVACAVGMQHRLPASVEVLVDACQFRLAFSTLRAYVANGFWVALTGSKFVTGPAFSGALLIPQAAAHRLRRHALPASLAAGSARAEWPLGWEARATLDDTANFGLLLRWEAALAELRQFAALPEEDVRAFLQMFADAIVQRLDHDPAFERTSTPMLRRSPLAEAASWDEIPTIFPFFLRRPGHGGALLDSQSVARVYRRLGEGLSAGAGVDHLPTRSTPSLPCQLGQPVACGRRDDVPVSALRICSSMRLVHEAVSPQGVGAGAVIADALSVLDKAAWLVQQETHDHGRQRLD